MSSRSRVRPNHNQDADEERRLWNEIRANAKKIDGMVVSVLCYVLERAVFGHSVRMSHELQ